MTTTTTIQGFAGEVIVPGDPAYDAARRTVLGEGTPAYVVRPANREDVQAAVRFAAYAGLPPAVRGGGHSFAGFGTNDGGIVIDLTMLDEIEVLDAEGGLVRIGGGATWGQVADALAPYGLAISSGDTRSVGVGGLTLSGGIGWKVRRHGLALDSLLAVEVVTADGRVVRASTEENPDLFWALRGGGGNVGIATAFEFAAHPTTDVHFGRLTFPATEAASVLQGWAAHLRTAPEELTSGVAFANPFLGGPEAPVELLLAYDGDDGAAARQAIDPIRALGTVLSDDVALTPYAEVLEEGRAVPPGIGFDVRSGFVDHAGVADALAVLAEVGAQHGSPVIALRALGGALARVDRDHTAYAHRDAALLVVTTLIGPCPALEAGAAGHTAVWERLAPYLSGAYANFQSGAAPADVAAVYPDATYRRLAEVKHRWDPANLFTGNHNVAPAT
jgi:FAD/FMN-containing dehydrogenase